MVSTADALSGAGDVVKAHPVGGVAAAIELDEGAQRWPSDRSRWNRRFEVLHDGGDLRAARPPTL
jgi:hypothetical protein